MATYQRHTANEAHPQSVDGSRHRAGRWTAFLPLLLLWPLAAGAQTPPATGGGTYAPDAKAPARVDIGQAVIGKHLFRSFCASCHGESARGDGSIAEMLRVPPADLVVLARENGGEFPFLRTVAVIDGREPVQGHGSSEMPAWGNAFGEISATEEEVQQKIQQLAHYLWSIQLEAEDAGAGGS